MQTPPFPLTEHGEYDSPIGILQIGIIEHALAWIGLPTEGDQKSSLIDKKNNSITMQQVKDAFDHYFADASYRFNLPLFIHGTPFQKKVWEALQTLHCGETLTYGDLAARLKTHPRAIGNACRTNRIPLIIPCHRILGKSSPGGYSGKREGEWPAIKRWLLAHEGSNLPQ